MLNSKQTIRLIKIRLKNPNSWIKGKSWGLYLFGIRKCLNTVVEDCARDMDFIERRKMYDCLFESLPKPFLSVSAFNDSSQTTHKDLMNYLNDVEQKLSFKV
jgi:hypothetical protein